ncbi:hypothetical protein CY34DRAFT_812309 [Suillus luteus UH-Slu-Lm8-n1]|uniref:Uncharacterized protein n=1 Tax=Suillus luteus UH-Slu-Lm8-n1 TaxID=930992 RepID=A0A0D0ATH3_9AGAM|nr:hypothetical protein CY34DRAFT_812309 [Suillus luteus UH-Slu-Lm8-n1]
MQVPTTAPENCSEVCQSRSIYPKIRRGKTCHPRVTGDALSGTPGRQACTKARTVVTYRG